MDQRVRRFREMAEEHNAGRPRTAFRYPAEGRALAIDYGVECLERGASMRGIAAELGVTSPTLGRWLEKASPARFREVAVVEPRGAGACLPVMAAGGSAGSLALVTPSGYRVEGLSLGDVRMLLEVLG